MPSREPTRSDWWRLDAGDEAGRVPGADDEVRGLVEEVDQPVQVRERGGPQARRSRSASARRARGPGRRGRRALVLHGEVAVDEHGEQPVGGGPGDTEPLGRLGDRECALELQHRREPQRVVDAGRSRTPAGSSAPWAHACSFCTTESPDSPGARWVDSRAHDARPPPLVPGAAAAPSTARASRRATPELEELYRGFEKELLVPLWTEIGDLMPAHPRSQGAAAPVALGQPAAAGRAGRRARAGRPRRRAPRDRAGQPVAWAAGRSRRPTLWAAIQYLMPGEDAPEHRHTQHAFRFVVEGEGVWTVVGGDPVADAPRRLPAAGRLELARPPQRQRASRWPGSTGWTSRSSTSPRRSSSSSAATRSPRRSAITPDRSRVRAAVGPPRPAPGRRRRAAAGTPLLAYRWEDTDRALADQLALEAEGFGGAVEPGHAAVRFTNPATGGDVLPTIRAEMHRIARGAETAPRREVGSSVYQVFDGSGTRHRRRPSRGRSPAATCSSSRPGSRSRSAPRPAPPTPTPAPWTCSGSATRPIFEALHLHRTHVEGTRMKLATIRIDGRHPGRQGRRRPAGRPRRRPTSAPSSPRPTGATRPSPPTGPSYPLEGADFAPLVPQPVKVVCVGLNYTQPHPGDGPRPARVPDAVLQVRRHPDRRRPTTSCGPPRPRRSTGRSSSRWSSARRSAAPATADGRGRDRRLHRPQRHHLPRLAVPHPRVAAGQELGRAPRRSAPTWSPPTSCPAASGPRCDVRLTVDGEVDAVRQHRRPAVRPGRAGRVRLHDDPAQPGRHHRHRHAGRGRPRPQARAVPRRRRDRRRPRSTASAGCANQVVKEGAA